MKCLLLLTIAILTISPFLCRKPKNNFSFLAWRVNENNICYSVFQQVEKLSGSTDNTIDLGIQDFHVTVTINKNDAESIKNNNKIETVKLNVEAVIYVPAKLMAAFVRPIGQVNLQSSNTFTHITLFSSKAELKPKDSNLVFQTYFENPSNLIETIKKNKNNSNFIDLGVKSMHSLSSKAYLYIPKESIELTASLQENGDPDFLEKMKEIRNKLPHRIRHR